jgi:hypothetical protein
MTSSESRFIGGYLVAHDITRPPAHRGHPVSDQASAPLEHMISASPDRHLLAPTGTRESPAQFRQRQHLRAAGLSVRGTAGRCRASVGAPDPSGRPLALQAHDPAPAHDEYIQSSREYRLLPPGRKMALDPGQLSPGSRRPRPSPGTGGIVAGQYRGANPLRADQPIRPATTLSPACPTGALSSKGCLQQALE